MDMVLNFISGYRISLLLFGNHSLLFVQIDLSTFVHPNGCSAATLFFALAIYLIFVEVVFQPMLSVTVVP